MANETTYGQRCTSRGIFSPIFGMHGRILMKLIRITQVNSLPGPYNTMAVRGHGFNGQGHRPHIPKCNL